MGGEDSGVSETTTDVMLEIAYFTPERIARTGQTLGLTSDARSRFERGVDPAFLDDGLAILTGLILDICGGEPSAAVRAGEPPVEQRSDPLRFRPHHRRSAASTCPPTASARSSSSLGFAVERRPRSTVPTWRRDVDGPADLVEEVARIDGYDKVPSTPLAAPPGVAKPTATRSQLVERRVRRTAAARGLDEAVTWSFISEKRGGRVRRRATGALANPISEEMKVMRPSLLPGLIAAARRNLDRGAASVRLFEIGRRYLGRRRAADAWRCCSPASAGRATGSRARRRRSTRSTPRPRCWRCSKPPARRSPTCRCSPTPARPGIRAARPRSGSGRRPSSPASASCTRACRRRSTRPPARLPPKSISTPSRRRGRAAAPAPPMRRRRCRRSRATSPSSSRRILPPTHLLRAIRGADKAAITGVRLFDRFEAADGLSLAFEVTLQPTEKSFTDEEIGEISRRIVAAAEKLGARLQELARAR